LRLVDVHPCDPPMEPRSVDLPTDWICPDCGDRWVIRPLAPLIGVAPQYTFGDVNMPTTPAIWERIS